MVNECTRHPYLVFPPQHFFCPEFGEGSIGVAELYLYLSVSSQMSILLLKNYTRNSFWNTQIMYMEKKRLQILVLNPVLLWNHSFTYEVQVSTACLVPVWTELLSKTLPALHSLMVLGRLINRLSHVSVCCQWLWVQISTLTWTSLFTCSVPQVCPDMLVCLRPENVLVSIFWTDQVVTRDKNYGRI